jgi:hypothetical protein
MEQSFAMQVSLGAARDGDEDELKRMFVETNPYLLGLTVIVTLLHTVFDCLAFKNGAYAGIFALRCTCLPSLRQLACTHMKEGSFVNERRRVHLTCVWNTHAVLSPEPLLEQIFPSGAIART